jgi:hypothetical protein
MCGAGGFRSTGRLNMAKKSKKAKRGPPARTKKRMKATRKKKPVSKPAAPFTPSPWEGFAGAKKEKKPVPKPASPPDAPSVWESFGGKTEDH